ncbi:hypothetical protein SCP_1002040 [Sparassis crispa]|uniref:Uncharacterized protein n=1 Tax=Sparassis crispa TaxID=139825 RepID=A0A401GXS6_9APHY|nr:hypothetical protein SCP_1002040 [Sparassis crispa]GBE86959.1 hypothetical protein SCP_1002040 [Sparassis crispa]
MAALFLHQALFTTEPSASSELPVLRSPNRVTQHERQLSSVSSVTLRTSNSDHSQPTEPLLRPESSIYLDLLSRQPNHPDGPESSFNLGLSLEGDPITPRERKSCLERAIRKRLRRLRWTRRTTLLIMTSWAVYNTVRYYVAFTMFEYRPRQIVLLVLGTCTALSIALVISSLLISAFAPHIGWYHTPHAPHVIVQTVLYYCASVLLLGPAVANLVFVFLWRHSAETIDTLRGRCHWDIDVLWSGVGTQCDGTHSPTWASWVAGSVVRLVLTVAVIITYHWSAYRYDVTRQPSRKYRLFHPRTSVSSVTPLSNSSQTFRPTATMSSTPVTIGQALRRSSLSGTTEDTYESAQTCPQTEQRTLRKSQSRIASRTSNASKDTFQLPSATGVSTARRPSGQITPRRVSGMSAIDDESPKSSDEEDVPGPSETKEFGYYGRQVRPSPGIYASVVSQGPRSSQFNNETSETLQVDPATVTPYSERDLTYFVDRFRTLVEQVARENEDAFPLAAGNGPDGQREHSTANADEHVPMVGRIVHRMPTIESLGSHEVMSLASSGKTHSSNSPHNGSRPSTRTNTQSLSEGYSTPSSRSRANSWDAALALASPVGNRTEEGSVSEMGELTHAETGAPVNTIAITVTNTTTTTASGESRSSNSYYTARTSPQEKIDDEVGEE